MALEALARRRQAEGRPALAVAWGPIEDAGYLADAARRPAMRWRAGSAPSRSRRRRLWPGFPAMIASGLPVVAFAETNWNEARRFLPILAAPLFAESRAKAAPSPV